MKAIFFTSAFLCCLTLAAQDTIHHQPDSMHAPFKPDRPTEVGISMTTPLLIAFGVTDETGRFNNFTIRHRVNNKHAIRAFIGAPLPKSTYPDPAAAGIITGTQVTYYQTVQKSQPTNFQVGIGYEYMFGGRVKQVPGIDIVYNNIFEKEEYSTLKVQETVDAAGNRFTEYEKLDSTVVIKTHSSDNFGVNLNYSIRYPLSRRFVFTTSFIAALRYSQRRSQNGQTTTNMDFNVYGLIGDISIFYRF